jgi:hypothetical protein
MVCSKNGPRGASTEPKRIGLLVKCEESLADEGVPDLPDFARLSNLRSHVVSAVSASTTGRPWSFAHIASTHQ